MIDSKSVAGGVYRNSSGEFEGVKCTYDATFTSPVWKEPPPNYSGTAAITSLQGKAALVFLKAGERALSLRSKEQLS